MKHFVFEGRDPDWTGVPVAFRDLHATDRRSAVRSGLEAVEQRLEIALQIDCIFRRRLVVDTHRTVLACLLIGDAEKLHVDVMGQRADGHLRGRPCQLCDSL